MKKTIMLFAAILMIAGFSNKLMAQETATATATATIVAPIGIANAADMNFGNVAVISTGGGTVVLTPGGARSTSGDVTLPATAGTVTAASFDVTGQDGYTYAITLPSAGYTITNTTGVGGETMTVDVFTSDPSGTGTLTGGSEILNVGATLNVAAGQVAGEYTNATGFDVTVNYN